MDDTTASVLVAALVVVVPVYLLLAFYPAETGRWLAGHLRGAQQPASLWDLTAIVQRRRAVVRWLLGALILAVSGVVLAALPAVRQRFSPELPDAVTVLWVLAFVAGIAVVARLRAAGLGRPALPEITDVAFADRVRQSMEGVSIAAGIAAPHWRVVGHPRPTAFTVLRGGEPVVTFTSGLVTLLPVAELEAVAAHETAHVASRAVEETRTLETMLDALRVISTGALWPSWPCSACCRGASGKT